MRSHRKYWLWFPLLLLAFLQPSCEIINRDEQVPAFLRIDTFLFQSIYSTQGLNTADLTDAHVFVNNVFMGIYEVPATVPVLVSGNARISILPGAKENLLSIGHRNIRVLKVYDTIITLEPGVTHHVKPHTTYRENVRFAWIEDFEDNSNSLVFTNRSSRDFMEIIEAPSPWAFRQGVNSLRSLHCDLGTTDSFKLFEIKTFSSFNNLPVGGRDVYLELDYRSNIALQVGFFKDESGIYEQIPLVILPPTGDRWRKAYLNYVSELAVLKAGTPIELYFGAIKLAGDNLEAKFSLDNLKLSFLE
jgi:hypothetical protein